MLLDQVVLVLAICALGDAALRVATRVAVGPLSEQLLVAAPLAAAFVACWTLALGLIGLAGSVTTLAAGPFAAWVAVRLLLQGSSATLAAQLLDRWDRASGRQRAGALAILGAAAGCVVEVARQPGFDIDSLAYHLADVVGWLHSGHAGAVQTLSYDFPVGYYPVTNEILLTWVLGISRSFAPLAAWSTTFAALGLLALWRLQRVLGVSRTVAGMALAAFATLPMFVNGLNATDLGTDLPALSWLACAAALSMSAVARPQLMAPALVAAGLGIGTKTTVAPLAAAALVIGAWRARSAPGWSRMWLASGALGGALVGGPWYVRDALAHGWPLWPFSSGPTGDPLPHAMSLFRGSFLSRPIATVSATPGGYLKWVAGGIGLIAGTVAIPALARTRAALVAWAVALAALLAWAVAPFTGVAPNPLLAPLALTTVRYLLAALAACAVALAIASAGASPFGRRLIVCLLGAAVAASLIADRALGYPVYPRPQYLLAGAVVGAALGAAGGTLRSRRPWRPAWAIGVRLGAVALAALLLALSARGWLDRASRDATFGAPVLAFMLRQPGFASGRQTIGFAPAVIASLAGPRLRHPVDLIPAQEPCGRVRARLRRGWVVVWPKEFATGITHAFDAAQCLRADRPLYSDGMMFVYGPASAT